MGEAKRRRALGLMPEVENREVTITRDGDVSGDALPPAVLDRLTAWAETGERWDARYRTTFIGTGLPRELLHTDDDLMAIPVPDRMRLKIGLLSGSAQWLAHEQETSPESFYDDGGQPRQLNVRSTEYNFGGQWSGLPEFESQEALRYLTQHPAVVARPRGTDHLLTVWHGGERAGQTEIEPAPEAGHRDALVEAAQVFLGESDGEWAADHLGRLSGVPTDPDDLPADAALPLARRMTLTLSAVPLVLSPTVQVLARSGDMDVVYAQGQEAYTDDGQTWTDYPAVQDRNERLQALLGGLGISDVSELHALLSQAEAGEAGDGPARDDRTLDAELVGRKPLAADTGEQPGQP